MNKTKGSNDSIDENQSFVIEIKNREHHTWQGTVAWVEGKKKENFRSALELLKLIDSTFDQGISQA